MESGFKALKYSGSFPVPSSNKFKSPRTSKSVREFSWIFGEGLLGILKPLDILKRIDKLPLSPATTLLERYWSWITGEDSALLEKAPQTASNENKMFFRKINLRQLTPRLCAIHPFPELLLLPE